MHARSSTATYQWIASSSSLQMNWDPPLVGPIQRFFKIWITCTRPIFSLFWFNQFMQLIYRSYQLEPAGCHVSLSGDGEYCICYDSDYCNHVNSSLFFTFKFIPVIVTVVLILLWLSVHYDEFCVSNLGQQWTQIYRVSLCWNSSLPHLRTVLTTSSVVVQI